MKLPFGAALATLLAFATTSKFASAFKLVVNDTASVRDASTNLAFGVQSYYHNNESSTPATSIGTLPLEPWYWWLAGAMWGGMVDHWAYTDDSSYNAVIQQAIMAQVGPDFNFMPPAYFGSLGNDDQAFWAFSALSAYEYSFPPPEGQGEDIWLDLAVAVFNTQVPRWDTAKCGGGLKWQVFESNKGYNYRNSVSNGAFLQIAARLARITGNQTYVDWAGKTWDWMNSTGLIGSNYQVYDGTDDLINCTEINHIQWSYNPAILLHASATMANLTNLPIWQSRTDGLLTSILNTFFSPYPNATSIMYEPACEPSDTCNIDQTSFKGYLSRWMSKSAILQPSLTNAVTKYLSASALAIAASCTGGGNNNTTSSQTCGQKWYTGNYDGVPGVGQQLSALETVQSLLLLSGSATRSIPKTQANVVIQVVPMRKGR
ncbi:related to DFG5 protein [Ramularia collo-cygni]|uniref:Mannan endo-1,6-alpha-mannosidase n=1 Tax=Ramularia collo-cygni TaxID=112498 RepID=A0A2D3VKB0_9PEZI|nr:related to DFG5 protein [Ramularia collo-cygni]CZT24931.1 related to DFG5 protein [Ramularia collo-cygni]